MCVFGNRSENLDVFQWGPIGPKPENLDGVQCENLEIGPKPDFQWGMRFWRANHQKVLPAAR